MRMMRMVLWASAVLALAGAARADDGRHIDELLHESGIWTQAGQIEAQVRAGADEAYAQEKATGRPTLTDVEHRLVVNAMSRAFAPERMREGMRVEMTRALSPEDERAALAWLSTDLARRITRLEEDSGEPERAREAMQEMPEVLRSLSDARRDQVTRLATATRAGESGADMMINMTTAIVYGVASMKQDIDAQALNTLKRRIEAQRAAIASAAMDHAVGQFAYTYRTLSDTELERYVAFAESPPGRGYHEASMRAYDAVITHASLEMGRYIGSMKPPEPRRSS